MCLDAEKYLAIVPSIVPWPEWNDPPYIYQLDGDDVGWFRKRTNRVGAYTYLGDHVALCILQRAVREWLEAWATRRDLYVQYRADSDGCYVSIFGPEGGAAHVASGLHRTIDDALIAAVQAAHEESHE